MSNITDIRYIGDISTDISDIFIHDCDISIYVATQGKIEEKNLCRDLKSPVATLIIATWKILLKHCMKKLCHDKVMNVATLKDKVSSPDRETKLRQVMLT